MLLLLQLLPRLLVLLLLMISLRLLRRLLLLLLLLVTVYHNAGPCYLVGKAIQMKRCVGGRKGWGQGGDSVPLEAETTGRPLY